MLNIFRNARLKYKFWCLNILVLLALGLLSLYAINEIATATEQPFADVLVEKAPGFALVLLILMLMEMAGSQLLISFIERHVNRLKDTMVAVQASGDLSQRALVDSRDEIGEMGRAFNAMQDRTMSVVRSMKDAIGRLHEEARELSESAVRRRDDLVSQQAGAERSAQAVDSMMLSFAGIAEQAGMANTLSQEARKSAVKGNDQVASTAQAITQLATAIEGSARSVQSLAANSQEIGQAVAEIKGIADQTNLLALNAAIEAARAGEQGRGFAVVADEVRRLAQRVQVSTDQIQGLIDRLLAAMATSVQQMKDGSANASLCVEQANDCAGALDAITTLVTRISDSNDEIASVSARQTAGTEDTRTNLQSIRSTTQEMVTQLGDSVAMGQRLRQLIQELELAARKVRV
ncbi:methyl-accepting chemotaxis protein [Marinobacter salicampi]|uniref:methyl-accepting chemotaxis protein n=1 Tax=Marinobacter salicampi TaxID=435907 RepID=UPI00140B6AEC|nr:methyl-accepting chemotaxis protein [Marinobacter salicampi]